MNSITFAYELNTTTWLVIADLEGTGGTMVAYLTDARPDGAPPGERYDVSDLEDALAEDGRGRTLGHVRDAALAAYLREAESRLTPDERAELVNDARAELFGGPALHSARGARELAEGAAFGAPVGAAGVLELAARISARGVG